MFRLSIRTCILFGIFTILPFLIFAAAPTNDNCSGAGLLTSATTCSTTAGTLASATSSGIAASSTCGGTPDDDVWYKFVAFNQSITVTLSGIQNGNNKLGNAVPTVELLSGICSAGLVSLGCATGTSASLTNTALTPGSTYYIRVYSGDAGFPTNSATFSICITHGQPPSNDECTSSTALAMGTINSSGTVWNANTSSNIPTGCATGTPNEDVWYSFTATATTSTISLSSVGANLSTAGTILQLFSGSCSSLTSLNCGTTTITATGLTINSTYYIRVYASGTLASGSTSGGSGFSITVNAPLANDDCTGASALVIGTATTGTVWGATNSNVAAVCSGTPDDDVWYKFTATASSATIALSSIGTDLNTSGAMVQLFSGTCNSLTSIACGSGGITALSLTSGNTYHLCVYSVGNGSIGSTASGSAFSITITGPSTLTKSTVTSSQTSENFQQTTLSAAGVLSDPWEIAYGADGNLWITEAKGYKVYRMDPATGQKSTVLDISNNSTFLLPGDTTFNVKFTQTSLGTLCNGCWPQGGMAGLVLHPKFMDPITPSNYVYISYVFKFKSKAANNGGIFFTNRLVRFTYNTGTGKLDSPVSLCDTLPGSSDHNSQRIITAPVNGTNYLFYAEGDMGGGQYDNAARALKAQDATSYEGKILRFNLESDGDADTLDRWIPNDNPYNGTSQSAVWSTGIRNNQGFAYATINGTGYLYGSSHGPYSDDEINIIEKGKNYGHPKVIGYATDNNYNGSSAGNTTGSIPVITSETANAAAIGATYKDPIFSIYAPPRDTVYKIYSTNPANSGWPSVAPSGMDVYTNAAIPGWKNSLLVSYLKGGRVMRLKLNAAGDGVNTADTVAYFRSVNRFRDVALSPDGKSIFVIIDKSSTTSGPTSSTPMVSACAGCVLKYTFLGYSNTVVNTNNKSTLSTSVAVTTGTANNCTTATIATIDATNNNIWVPITGPDGNIMAEIKANNNNLGAITGSLYTNAGTVRQDGAGKPYLDRNMTLTPATQPATPVSVRLYITATEFEALKAATNSDVMSVSNLTIFKNNDACGSTLRNAPLAITPTYAEAFGTGGYVVEAEISSFSSFYFGSGTFTVLPVQLVDFKGTLKKNDALLQWNTGSENGTAYFAVERSMDGVAFAKVGTVNATGSNAARYEYIDRGAALLAGNLVYYRLKMVDEDGTFAYSKTITMRLPERTDVTVYPNPVKNKLSIRISRRTEGEITVQVTDVQGRDVYTGTKRLSGSTNLIDLDVRRWKPQLYVIKITNSKAEVLATQKFEKL